MKFKQRLVNIARNAIITSLAFATFSFPVYSKSPYDSFDANTQLWDVVNQETDKKISEISDVLESSVAGRTLTSLLQLETKSITAGISHEIAHYVPLRKTNPNAEIQWGDFFLYTNGAFMPKMEYPCIMSNLTKKLVAQHMVSGLNENENDANFLVTKSPNTISSSDAFAFLTSKFFDEVYFLGEELYHPKGTDLSNYRNVVLKKFAEIELSKSQLLSQMLISDLLSARTYESVLSVINFILQGETETPSFSLNLGNVNISSPLISFYQTPEGSAYDVSTILSLPKDTKIRFSLLSDKFCLGESNLNTIRAGISLYNLNLGDVHLNISSAVDVKNSSITGNYSSVSINYSPNNLTLSLKVLNSKDDVLHNLIKCYDNGWEIEAGINLSF